MSYYAVVIKKTYVVVNVISWAAGSDFQTPPYQAYDVDRNPAGDPQPTTAVPDTDPPTAMIGGTYNPATGTFSPPV